MLLGENTSPIRSAAETRWVEVDAPGRDDFFGWGRVNAAHTLAAVSPTTLRRGTVQPATLGVGSAATFSVVYSSAGETPPDFVQVVVARLWIGRAPWIGDRRHVTHVMMHAGIASWALAPLLCVLAVAAWRALPALADG